MRFEFELIELNEFAIAEEAQSRDMMICNAAVTCGC